MTRLPALSAGRRWLALSAVAAALLTAGCGSSSLASHSHAATTSSSASQRHAATSSSAAAPAQTPTATTGAKASGSSTAAAGGASSTVVSGHATIPISGYAYHPATITVKAGTKLTFTNKDMTPHTATATGGAFDTGTINPGQSKTVSLHKAGTYAYMCQFHPFMHGTVVVK